MVADTAGGILVTTGLMLPVGAGAAGLAVDVAIWHGTRISVQSAADAAALAGAIEQTRSSATDAEIRAAATADAARNGFSVANGDQVEIAIDPNAKTVEAIVRTNPPVLLASTVLGTSVTVGARALAGSQQTMRDCLVVLDESAAESLLLDSNAQVTANGCAVRVNSTSSTALRNRSNAQMESGGTCVTGGYSGGGFTPTPETNCDQQDDPLASLPEPDTSGCDETNYSRTHGSHALSPGVYCGGITLDSNTTAVFQPGTYVIKDGPLRFDSNIVASGEGVTFYLTGSNALIQFRSNAAVDFSGPTEGDYAGIVFYEDRDAAVGNFHELRSNAQMSFEGAVYLPNGDLEVNSNADLVISGDSPHTSIVARRVHLNSNARLTLNSNPSDVPIPPELLGTSSVALIE